MQVQWETLRLGQSHKRLRRLGNQAQQPFGGCFKRVWVPSAQGAQNCYTKCHTFQNSFSNSFVEVVWAIVDKPQPVEQFRLKNENRDMHLPLWQTADQPMPVVSEESLEFADEIISAEVGKPSWTLMHRYNLCHRLLSEFSGGEEEMILLFVWLRFSAIRQLDWQRRYNTKPRELAHAQGRLTNRLAERYGEKTANRLWICGILQTLGRGGDGQNVRDQILHIMHLRLRQNISKIAAKS